MAEFAICCEALLLLLLLLLVVVVAVMVVLLRRVSGSPGAEGAERVGLVLLACDAAGASRRDCWSKLLLAFWKGERNRNRIRIDGVERTCHFLELVQSFPWFGCEDVECVCGVCV